MHGKSTKQRRAARRRRWIQHLLRLGCPQKYLVYLKTPPELRGRLTHRERMWAEDVASRLNERASWSDITQNSGAYGRYPWSRP